MAITGYFSTSSRITRISYSRLFDHTSFIGGMLAQFYYDARGVVEATGERVGGAERVWAERLALTTWMHPQWQTSAVLLLAHHS